MATENKDKAAAQGRESVSVPAPEAPTMPDVKVEAERIAQYLRAKGRVMPDDDYVMFQAGWLAYKINEVETAPKAELRKEEVMPTESSANESTADTRPSGEDKVAGGPTKLNCPRNYLHSIHAWNGSHVCNGMLVNTTTIPGGGVQDPSRDAQIVGGPKTLTITLEPRANSSIWIARCKETNWVASGNSRHEACASMCEIITCELEYALAHGRDIFHSIAPVNTSTLPSEKSPERFCTICGGKDHWSSQHYSPSQGGQAEVAGGLPAPSCTVCGVPMGKNANGIWECKEHGPVFDLAVGGPSAESPWREIARLSEQERIDLFTLLGQWSRNIESQAEKVTEWFERRQEGRIALAVEAHGALFQEQWDKYPFSLPVITVAALKECMAELLERQVTALGLKQSAIPLIKRRSE